MASEYQQLKAAGKLGGDELGAVLSSLGPNGNCTDRLAAVVALLATDERDGNPLVRGAFAGVGPAVDAKVRTMFTSALHGCLRERPVNAASPATPRSA